MMPPFILSGGKKKGSKKEHYKTRAIFNFAQIGSSTIVDDISIDQVAGIFCFAEVRDHIILKSM